MTARSTGRSGSMKKPPGSQNRPCGRTLSQVSGCGIPAMLAFNAADARVPLAPTRDLVVSTVGAPVATGQRRCDHPRRNENRPAGRSSDDGALSAQETRRPLLHERGAPFLVVGAVEADLA